MVNWWQCDEGMRLRELLSEREYLFRFTGMTRLYRDGHVYVSVRSDLSGVVRASLSMKLAWGLGCSGLDELRKAADELEQVVALLKESGFSVKEG